MSLRSMGSRSHSVWVRAPPDASNNVEGPVALQRLSVNVDRGSSVVLPATGECTEPPRTRGFYLGRAVGGVRGVADKGGSARRDAVQQMFQAAGGKLESFYFAFGDTDAYVLGELPNDEAATAVALNVNKIGAAKVRTVVLLAPERVDSAAKTSLEYRPPGA
jgi:uncharacterized protein with GYD domain